MTKESTKPHPSSSPHYARNVLMDNPIPAPSTPHHTWHAGCLTHSDMELLFPIFFFAMVYLHNKA